jgi:hypothetical protein
MANYGFGSLGRWRERDVIKMLYAAGWQDADKLLQMACTVDAESGCYPHAWHWNSPTEGGDGSCDWGMFQLNDGNKGGTAPQLDTNGDPITSTQFQKDALTPGVAVVTARGMYKERGFQPWYGYAKWKNYAPAMTRALCNWLREKYNIPLL